MAFSPLQLEGRWRCHRHFFDPNVRSDWIDRSLRRFDSRLQFYFSWKSGGFGGKLFVGCALNKQERKLVRNLKVECATLKLVKTAIDSVSAKLKLQGTELAVEQLNVKRKNDSLNAEGKIEMSGEHNYS